MTFQALHGTADRHDYRVDLHCDLTCRSQDKNLRDEDKEKLSFYVRKDLVLTWWCVEHVLVVKLSSATHCSLNVLIYFNLFLSTCVNYSPVLQDSPKQENLRQWCKTHMSSQCQIWPARSNLKQNTGKSGNQRPQLYLVKLNGAG